MCFLLRCYDPFRHLRATASTHGGRAGGGAARGVRGDRVGIAGSWSMRALASQRGEAHARFWQRVHADAEGRPSLFMPVLLPATSLTEVKRIMAWQDQVISGHPGAVASVAGKLGRADSATDPAPVEMIETTIMLKPEREWPEGTTKKLIIADLSAKLTRGARLRPGFSSRLKTGS
ncbi:MAG: hypothetical protein QM760_02800 [Nibricoccus sp.]